MGKESLQLQDKILVTQCRSQIGRDESIRRTLKALGLGRVGRSVILPRNGSVQGMIRKVEFLVSVKLA